MELTTALPLVWAGIIAFGVSLYVLLDGFSLGVAILFPFAVNHAQRSTMMNSVAPVWDGNQTWLVMGGTLLFGAFPMAFGELLAALYLPLIVMLVALVFRGAAFEFRAQAADPTPWDWAFAVGATVAGFCQGWVLGAYVLGIVEGPILFCVITGVAVIVAYALIGSCWLLMKTDGSLNAQARRWATRLLPLTLAGIAAVSLWTPLAEHAIAARWFSWPNLLFLAPVPIFTAALSLSLYLALRRGADFAPFILCIGLYLLTLAGLGISLWPFIVPRSVTLWQAASPPDTQLFLLAGVAIIVPVVLIYTAHAYYVFRGKVSADEGY